MPKEFKILPAKYVVVGYRYPIEIPGTTGTTMHNYWIVVTDFEKKTVEEAIMKFAVDVAKTLKEPDMIKVESINCREIKENEYKLN